MVTGYSKYMPQTKLSSFAPSTKIYHGDSHCPRTVVVQQQNLPGGGGHQFVEAIFFLTDQGLLDNASFILNSNGTSTGILSNGIVLGKNVGGGSFPPGNYFTLVLKRVTKDIFARAIYFDTTSQINEFDEPILLGVEVF